MSMIGRSIPRVEDRRFLTGRGQYVGDLSLPRQCCAAVVLSQHAHAIIRSVDASAARGAPGVVCVLTGEDAAADGLGGLAAYAVPEDWGGPSSYRTSWPVLVRDRVRCVGDRIAFVVAETADQARDAAERVSVVYEPLPAILTPSDALKADAPLVWEDCPKNVCFALVMGDKDATDAAFAQARSVVRDTVNNQRLSANPLEPRAALGEYHPESGEYTLYTSSQNPHGVRRAIAGSVLRIAEGRVRVVSPDVGGGFGMKANAYPEDALVLWASRRCGRPVKWVSTRAEGLMSDNHGRDQVETGEMALDADGHILAIKVDAVHSLGAYFVSASAAPVGTTLKLIPGVYRVPSVWLNAQAVFTNTSPIGVYRGAGRPEANILVERLLDRAAALLGIGQADIRRRNLIARQSLPYETVTKYRYDSGDFPAVLDACLKLIDWESFPERQRDSTARGKLRGRAVSNYIEYGGVQNDRMELRLDEHCEATIFAGTHSHGQGHATAFAQIVSDRLGIPVESVRYVQGDTARVAFGRGTYAARSSLVGGCALVLAAEALLAKARRMAAALAAVSEADLAFYQGSFQVNGTNRFVPLAEVAKACYGGYLPAGIELGLEAVGTFGSAPPNFPNGCHACEVEVDCDTGEVTIDKYAIADDVGTMINPMICEGQIHGGLAQGLGQALLEEVVYDADGQLLTGSFMDYAMPRASDFPAPDIRFHNVPATTNPLAIKAVGESSIIASPSVVSNAILDALRPLGVKDLEMPATPHRIARTIRAAGVRSRAG